METPHHCGDSTLSATLPAPRRPIKDSPTFLLATLLSARASGDTGLEAAASARLEEFGIVIEFVEQKPATQKRRAGK